MNIILIGYRGTGKSTVAKILGQRLERTVISTDEEIVKEVGQSIPQIVEKFGWDHFRDLETQMCKKLQNQNDLIIDTGGGLILKQENANILKANGTIFWLTAEVSTIVKRISGDTQRPSLSGTKTLVEEIEDILRRAGLREIGTEARTDLVALSRALDPGDFRQTVEKISLYKYGDDTALTPADVAACAPSSVEAGVDDVLEIVAEGRAPELGPVIQRLESQGVQPVLLAIMALRHFRALHAAASDPQGPGSGIARIRPPIFGPRRDKMQRQAQSWGMFKLETALKDLVEADLTLRSASRAPQMAVIERTLMRLAMLARR